jgi:hypothetical protein
MASDNWGQARGDLARLATAVNGQHRNGGHPARRDEEPVPRESPAERSGSLPDLVTAGGHLANTRMPSLFRMSDWRAIPAAISQSYAPQGSHRRRLVVDLPATRHPGNVLAGPGGCTSSGESGPGLIPAGYPPSPPRRIGSSVLRTTRSHPPRLCGGLEASAP